MVEVFNQRITLFSKQKCNEYIILPRIQIQMSIRIFYKHIIFDNDFGDNFNIIKTPENYQQSILTLEHSF